jgi:hypothetical protein
VGGQLFGPDVVEAVPSEGFHQLGDPSRLLDQRWQAVERIPPGWEKGSERWPDDAELEAPEPFSARGRGIGEVVHQQQAAGVKHASPVLSEHGQIRVLREVRGDNGIERPVPHVILRPPQDELDVVDPALARPTARDP